jgi:hypothetical protein
LYEEWGLKINIDKAKTVVFRGGGWLRKDEKWWLDGDEVVVVYEIKYYLGMMLDSRGKWDKERKQVLTMGKIPLSSIHICLERAPIIEVLEQIYHLLIQSRVKTGWKFGE